jgi:MFS family permease
LGSRPTNGDLVLQDPCTIRLGSGTVGLLIALTSVGGVLGAAVAPRLARRLGSARAFIGFELIAAPAALLIPLSGPGPRAALFAVGGFLVVAGVVGGNVLNATWTQTYTPRELRGRVSTCSGLVNYGGIPLGALCAGALASAVGTHDSIWIMTGLLALCPSLLLLSPLRGRREFPAVPMDGRGPRAALSGRHQRPPLPESPASPTAATASASPTAATAFASLAAPARSYPTARRRRNSVRRASAASRSRSVRSGSSSTNAQS